MRVAKRPIKARYTGPRTPALVEVRLTAVGRQRAPTDAQYIAACRAIAADGVVPEGWRVRGLQWRHFKAVQRGKRKGKYVATTWQAGSVVDVTGFPAALFAAADVGVERIGVRRREVTVEEVVAVRGANARYHAAETTRTHRKGQLVSDAYARRYPHLVVLDRATRRRVKRVVTVVDEEAVIRFTYEGGA